MTSCPYVPHVVTQPPATIWGAANNAPRELPPNFSLDGEDQVSIAYWDTPGGKEVLSLAFNQFFLFDENCKRRTKGIAASVPCLVSRLRLTPRPENSQILEVLNNTQCYGTRLYVKVYFRGEDWVHFTIHPNVFQLQKADGRVGR